MASQDSRNLVNILSELVAFQSVEADLAQKQQLFDYVYENLSQTGFKVNKHVSNGLPSLFATATGQKSPKLLLAAHLDVVPGDNSLFQMTETDGRLRGRGVFDMKFAAACYLKLAEELKSNLQDYDLGIMLTLDEEIGGYDGVEHLLKDQGYRADVCVLPDGGENWQIESVCNGVWLLKLTSEGKTAHGSRPWEGNNAILKLMAGLHEIRDLFGEARPDYCSLTISQINGGTAMNQVPDNAEAVLDMRFVNKDHYLEKQKQIKTIADDKGFELETIAQVDPCETDVKHPLVASFIEIAEDTIGKPIETTRSYGSSDARFFSQFKIPTILIRPAGGDAHSDQEWIDKEELNLFYEVLKQYVEDVARVS